MNINSPFKRYVLVMGRNGWCDMGDGNLTPLPAGLARNIAKSRRLPILWVRLDMSAVPVPVLPCKPARRIKFDDIGLGLYRSEVVGRYQVTIPKSDMARRLLYCPCMDKIVLNIPRDILEQLHLLAAAWPCLPGEEPVSDEVAAAVLLSQAVKAELDRKSNNL